MANSIKKNLFFMFSCFLLVSPGTCSNNETDLLALLALKSAINLDPMGTLNSWNETSHFCTWNGISCGRKHPNRVVAIRLVSQGLVGTLSPHIGNLSFLRSINLQNNTFSGQIPEEIGHLSRLERVEFSNNSFIGSLPQNLSQCKNISYLNVIGNQLTGTIPRVLGFLYKLEALGLGKNNLAAGPIPPFIGNLTSLRTLSLRSCNLTGEIPESLTRLNRLTYLTLGDNKLVGNIPLGLFNISTLDHFAFDINELEGSIPSNIGFTLPNLKNLILADNKFSGDIPTSISNMTSLEILTLTLNYFTGKMPRFSSLPNLRSIYIQNNPIRDDTSFLTSLTNCTKLQSINFGDNLSISGTLPESIANLSTTLSLLSITNTQIRGSIPSGIENLVGLTQIYLYGNSFEGPIPSGIGKLPNLQVLWMYDNQFTNEIPSSFGNLTSLIVLSLANNNISGNVPNSLSSLTRLQRLDLSRNYLEGPIPKGILNLSSLSIFLILSDNSFTGSIPFEVGSLRNLGILDLSNNRLSGTIPSSLSMCTSLERLHLEGNSLQGEIPRQLSALSGLQDMDLSRNNLSGTIPSFLGELRLENLNLSFNMLNGGVPTRGVFRNVTTFSLDGNDELCGGIQELRLPPCSNISLNSSNKNLLLKILIPTLIIVVLLFLCIVFVFFYKRRKPEKALSFLPSFIGNHFLRLSYADLLKATNEFSGANLLGFGRFGFVYKGILEDGQTLIAVKVLNLVVKGASKSFLAECNALRGIRHRNLLRILSVCESIDFQGNDFKALVYELKANGSLEKWLHEGRNLSMIERLNIAIDIAQAVEYLHFGTDSTIVHGDLKPSNILLDGDMNAYAGDFGLAKIVSSISLPSDGNNSSSIAIKGTVGYVAPEYGTNGVVSTQGDVYSYGILLLEVFTSRRPTDDSFKDGVNLHNFVSTALPDRVIEILDPLIQIEHDMNNHNNNKQFMDCVASVLSIGVACSKETPRDRMSMSDVVSGLRKIKDNYLAKEQKS